MSTKEKEYFDVLVITPLEEEFEVALEHFKFERNLSAPDQVRLLVTLGDTSLKILLVKQNSMGKTSTQQTLTSCLTSYDIGLAVCLGIAGGLASDINIGDVCYTGEIVDVLDNAKATGDESVEIAFSPTYYSGCKEIETAISLNRLLPDTKNEYENWRAGRKSAAAEMIPEQFIGKAGKAETIVLPRAREAIIACAAVSASSEYNKKLKALNRKILAVETESGGLFSIAEGSGVPALSVRGISDYADADKTRFEVETNGHARKIAAANAASFLALQLSSKTLQEWFVAARKRRAPDSPELPLSSPPTTYNLADFLRKQSLQFDGKLRELAPSYGLQSKGYRLPVPRIRIAEARGSLGEETLSDPMEVRDALRSSRVLVIVLPKEYPDHSLSWIIANDLLSAQVDDRQLVPVVIEANAMQRPRLGVRELSPDLTFDLGSFDFTKLVFIIDEVHYDSKTRTDFLIEQIESYPDAAFIIVTRDRANVLAESDFTDRSAATVSHICAVSFIEIAHFLQKNFEWSGPAAEVIATRLRETFDNFDLPAHPTYFAGIPRDILSALLQANRRAELIQLAVAGYLSFVVSEDDQPVALSRTTREKFLSSLVVALHVKKKNFNEADLVAFVDEFRRKYDFNISSLEFVASFVNKGILHFEHGSVQFTLPFIESYVLAKTLHEQPSHAEDYFLFGSGDFDIPTFTLYAEMGVSAGFLENLMGRLDAGITTLKHETGNQPYVLTGGELSPELLRKQERLKALQSRLQKAVDDVRADKDNFQDKQRLLDAADRIRETAARRVKEEDRASSESERSAVGDAIEAWFVAVTLLGAGAERLEAHVKRELIGRIIKLTNLAIDDWTRSNMSVDFSNLKQELLADLDFVHSLAASDSESDVAEARRIIDGLVDVLEFSFLAAPIRRLLGTLCEEARDKVLAESLQHADVEPGLETLFLGAWLSDVDVAKGKRSLMEGIKTLQKSRFLRVSLATHLLSRVYWKHWRKEDRLALLGLAQESLKGAGLRYDGAGIKRMIENESDPPSGG